MGTPLTLVNLLDGAALPLAETYTKESRHGIMICVYVGTTTQKSFGPSVYGS